MKNNLYGRLLHANMAVIGGIFGIYTILIRGSVLGNAQTSNAIQIIVDIIGRDWQDALYRLIGLALFMISCVVYVLLKNKTTLNLKNTALVLDITAIVICMILPENMNNVIALYPVFVAMPFQWNVFSGCFGYASSTIFSTNNFRQLSVAMGEYFCTGEKEYLKKAGFFGGSIAGFYIGIAVGFIATVRLGIYGIAVALIFVISGFVLNKKAE